MASVYIHIPFCEKVCSYCDFCKVLYNEKLVDKYLAALEKEVRERYKGEEVQTIYIGGGTPSSLNYEQLTKLFDICKIFNKNVDYEFTIEGNFESTDFKKIDLYKKYGINRVSFGLETTDEALLKFLNRKLDKRQVRKIINYCKNCGINNINVDLMYALLGEDLSILEKDLEFICSLDVKHISTYSLIIEDNTMLKVNGCKNISEDLDLAMYEFISKYLKSRGYKHYEISNFARSGYESMHNLVYWQNLEYYGIGLGASSYIDNIRSSNSRSIVKYLQGERVYTSEIVSLKAKMEYEILLGFRTIYGVSKEKFREKYGIKIEECYNYSRLAREGFILEDDRHIWINPDKWYVSNQIIVEFLEGEVWKK